MENIISLITAIISLVVTFFIGIYQIKQSERMAKFEKRQDERDEKRFKEKVDSKVVQFVTKYHQEIGLLPLCLMATLYDRYRPYNREMYLEFNALSDTVQDAILESQGLKIPRFKENFYGHCLKLLNDYLNKNFKSDINFGLYEGGKYLFQAIEKYGSKKTEYERISDKISDVINYNTDDKKRIDGLFYEVKDLPCEKICDAMIIIMYWVAYNSDDNSESENYKSWIPPYGEERIGTMEDMFLMLLLVTYLKLGLK